MKPEHTDARQAALEPAARLRVSTLVTAVLVAVAGAVLVVAGAAGVVRGQDTAPEPVRPTTAVVDIRSVFQRCDHTARVQADLEARRAEVQAELDAAETELRRLRDTLDQVRGEERDRIESEIARRLTDADVRAAQAEKELARRVLEHTVGTYRIIREEIAAWADARGVDLVLKADPRRFEADGLSAAQREIGSRAVLHARASLDATEAILQAVNDRRTGEGGER